MKKITLFAFLILTSLGWSQSTTWEWAYNHSLSSNDGRTPTAVDDEGNVYVIGNFKTPQFIVGTYTFDRVGPEGTWDNYIIKYNPAGEILWAKSYGGESWDSSVSVTVDDSNNVYITGTFQQNMTIDSVLLEHSGGSQFILKLNEEGNLLWVKKIPLSVSSIFVDANEQIYISGGFLMPSVTIDGVTLTYENHTQFISRCYVAKLDNQGTCIWAKAGQADTDLANLSYSNAVAVDADGSVYMGGFFSTPTLVFDDIVLTKSNTYLNSNNMFIVKYTSDGETVWAKSAGSVYENMTSIQTIVTDEQHNVYASGFFTNTVHFGAIELQTITGGSKIFTVKYDNAGNEVWVRRPVSPDGFNTIQSSDIDSEGNLYVAGTTSTDLVFQGGIMLDVEEEGGFFVARYNPDGNAVWAKASGAVDANAEVSVTCFDDETLYIAGTFSEPSLHFDATELIKTSGNHDRFIAKLNHEDALSTIAFEQSSLVVYPNPVQNVIHLANVYGDSEYTITDTTGKIVLTGQLAASNEIAADALASGIYILQLASEGKASATKIVKL